MQPSIKLQEGITNAYLTLKNIAASIEVQVGRSENRHPGTPPEQPLTLSLL
jgi:hypothetical protein